MTACKKIPVIALLAAAGALAAPAFAATTVIYASDPEDDYAPSVTYIEPALTSQYYYAPVYVAPPITIRAQRASEDALITDDVAYSIASDPRLSGRVGVETYRNEVTLSGRLTTPGQVEIASRDARAVDGVSEVHNYIRSRVGG